MRKVWNVILVIVVICIAVGAVSAGVGVVTGADFERIGSTLNDYVAEKYNLDADAFIHEWIPQSMEIIREELIIRQ